MLTLTVAEIRDLASFAGIKIDHKIKMDEMDLESEITITVCPKEGLRNEGEPTDSESISHYKYIAYMAEYQEEGCIGLGSEVRPNDWVNPNRTNVTQAPGQWCGFGLNELLSVT